MTLEFKLLPIMVTGDPVGTNAQLIPKTCIPFPCFSCKNYIREKFVLNDVFIIDINLGQTHYNNDGCEVNPGFTNLKYDDKGKSTCFKYKKDYAINRKL